MTKITPCLWFDSNAEEAVNFYFSVFKNSRILKTSYYGKAGSEIHGMPAGSVLSIDFELDGNKFVALNGGPAFKFNEAVSFQVFCDSQQEIDYYWEKLGGGGDQAAQQCGWLKDKYGLSWQIVPSRLSDMVADPDAGRANRVLAALMQMKKLDIQKLEEAYNEN